MSDSAYERFLASKMKRAVPMGFKAKNLNKNLKPFQADLVEWFCRLGRASCNTFMGSGKSLMELVWCEQAIRHSGKDALIVCPLAVAQQTKHEAEKFAIETEVTVCRESSDVRRGINLINYERLHKIDPSKFDIVSCDESSILKHVGSKTRQQIIESFRHARYKLPATAIPAPNDHMELGSQAEFCGWMTRSEMLATFFVHDSGDTAKWRLRGHAEAEFWKWLASWAAIMRSPADLGYDDSEYILPPIKFHEHVIETKAAPGMLFSMDAKTLKEQRDARRETINERAQLVANLVNGSPDQWVIWSALNDESETVTKMIPGAVEIAGKHSMEEKEERLMDFLNSKTRNLSTKGEICGFGINMQCCHNAAFLGISHSFELFFQVIGRIYRFGQKCPVNIHIVVSDRDAAVLANIHRKEADFNRMIDGMVNAMKDETRRNIKEGRIDRTVYQPTQALELPSWL
jgi:superfamily II DNA or RNA helicase